MRIIIVAFLVYAMLGGSTADAGIKLHRGERQAAQSVARNIRYQHSKLWTCFVVDFKIRKCTTQEAALPSIVAFMKKHPAPNKTGV